MTTYSRRSMAGHDSGLIHDARRRYPAGEGTTTLGLYPDGALETVCGLTLGQYGLVEHAIGPTCSACKRARKANRS